MENTGDYPINRKQLLSLPERAWDTVSEYEGVLLVPTGEKHDSGFMLIAIIGIRDGKSCEIAAYCDDVVWLLPTPIPRYSFRTDCYYPSGIMRMWSSEYTFKVGTSLSTTEIQLAVIPGKEKLVQNMSQIMRKEIY